MLTKSRLTLATTLVTVALGASPALAMPAGPDAADARQQDMYASTVERNSTHDARGEHAASLSDTPAASESPRVDLRDAAAREPFVQPVVVEVDEPISTGFDWTAAIIGIGAGLALAVLAGVGVAGSRRRHARPRTV
jgi:hypothetical protein